MSGWLPPGVTDYDIDRAAPGPREHSQSRLAVIESPYHFHVCVSCGERLDGRGEPPCDDPTCYPNYDEGED